MSDTLTTVTVVGYGSQGRAQALNLRDSGLDVRIGLRRGGASWAQAVVDGFAPAPVADAVAGADLVALLAPDMAQADLYDRALAGALGDGATLLFAHGFAIHYGLITPRPDLDVVLVAPKGPGRLVRTEYTLGRGVPALVAVHQDATGQAQARALAYCAAIGGARQEPIMTSFREETETDLFGEQAVLCGGMTKLVQAGFETLVEAGYQPEVAYYECLHELKLIVDLLYEGGIGRMHDFISDTARYGDLTRGSRVIGAEARTAMAGILGDIQSGRFAREWVAEHQAGAARFRALEAADRAHPVEAVGARLRATMGWLDTAASRSSPGSSA